MAGLLRAAEVVLVFEADRVTLRDASGPLRSAAGLAQLRRLTPEADRLLQAAALRAGDRVLDCTLGLGADALIAAQAVGPGGAVVGFEKSLPLALLALYGLAPLAGPASAAIAVQHADAGEALQRLPTGAFEVVLFDPMFERPGRSSPAFEALRRHAAPGPLTSDLLREARRVARRWVVIKGRAHSAMFRQLGLQPLPGRAASPVWWARLPPGG